MSWGKCTLADIVTIKKGEYITKKDAVSGKYPVILGGKEPAYYINKYNHVGKAIVISRSGASAGYVSFWNEPIFITDGFLIEPKQNTTHKFLFYLLKSKQSELSGIQRGAAIPHVTPSLINSINVSLPDLHMQNRIASILSAYDDLIENNQKQIKLLEEAAQRLYKEWFVDLRFPGWENTKIVDGVPEGWEKTTLNQIVTFHRGYDLTKNKMCSGTIPVVGSTSIIGYHNQYKVSGPGIVTGRSGSLGTYQLIWDDFWPHNTSLYISDFNGYDIFFIYNLLQTIDFTHLNTGGAIPTLNRNRLSNINITMPKRHLQRLFSDKVSPLYEKIHILELSLAKANELRSSILMKVMKG